MNNNTPSDMSAPKTMMTTPASVYVIQSQYVGPYYFDRPVVGASRTMEGVKAWILRQTSEGDKVEEKIDEDKAMRFIIVSVNGDRTVYFVTEATLEE